jgi:uncharacterized BrkB/YihY/UPF0761 family membrane protein
VHWKRIILYAVLLIVATFVAGFVPGVIGGLYQARNQIPPSWLEPLQALLLPASVLLVFLSLGRTQPDRPAQHAAAVWALTTVASLANIRLGITFSAWIGAATYSAVVAAIGTAIGTRFPARSARRSRTIADEKVI